MKRIMGLDVGTVRIGIALSDPLGLSAGRLTVLTRQGLKTDVEAVARLVAVHQVQRIVVGLPLTLRGTQSQQTQRVEAFAQALRRCVAIPVELIDERLTTVQANRALQDVGTSTRRRKHVIDQVAAQLILQQYLECQRLE